MNSIKHAGSGKIYSSESFTTLVFLRKNARVVICGAISQYNATSWSRWPFCFEECLIEQKNTIVPNTLLPCVEQLQQYFAGERHAFDLDLNPQGTDFQLIIWNLLLKLPFGSTISYLILARQYGNTKAVRAVAAAIGKNPILVVIPCHRVIGSDGTLVGYAGGMERKEHLLQSEGFPIQARLI